MLNIFPNKYCKWLLFNVFLTLQGVLFAAPDKSAIVDKNIELVMMDLNRQQLASQTTSAKRLMPPFPANCLKWSARQINLKAKKFAKSINKYSRQFNLDRNLVKSVITVESCFKTNALSRAGARGLMQLIPATAKRFGVKNSYNSRQNIRGGTKYLRFLLDRYKGDLSKAIAAYNAGEGRVDQYKGVPPYKETKRYVKNVLKTYALLNPNSKKGRVSAIYYPPSLGQKPGRHGWQYNRHLAPHLYKQK